ncbi:MAG: hypothetical protein ACE5FA_11975 [Dehalococcoidia bacterium]
MPESADLTATFNGESTAHAALEALAKAGIERQRMSIRTTEPSPESPFLARLIITIAAWSIAGGAIGAGVGALIWLLLGPSGTDGLVIQTVSWGIFGHLVIGLWAGYMLLADRTRADLPHERQVRILLTIVHVEPAALDRAETVIHELGGRVHQPPE